MPSCDHNDWLLLTIRGEKMEGTKGGSEVPAYEQLRLASIAENKRKLRDLVEIKRKYLALGENMRPSGEVGCSSQPAKKIYSEFSLLPVAGIKSYARSRHELAEELGYDLRRDEIFVRAHIRKTGVPTAQAETLIKQPEEVAELHPELKEKSIQGDFRAHVFGEKEPRGGVRKLCLGPTPQNVGTHGTKSKPPTKLAMEIQFRRQDEQVSTLLERTEQMQRQIGEMHQVLFPQGIRNVETPLPNNSASQPVLSGIVAQEGKGELLI